MFSLVVVICCALADASRCRLDVDAPFRAVLARYYRAFRFYLLIGDPSVTDISELSTCTPSRKGKFQERSKRSLERNLSNKIVEMKFAKLIKN